jgi:hypothetical protein
METAKRRIAGVVFVLVSVINLAAAYVWSRTGDVHRELHVVMKGGQPGFWATVVIFGVLLVAGLRLLIAPEPTFPAESRSQLTAAEKADLARWSRGLLVGYVAFFVLLVGGVLVGSGPIAQWMVAGLTTACVLTLLVVLSAKRCPSCRFRIAYGMGLLLPARCLKCGMPFK